MFNGERCTDSLASPGRFFAALELKCMVAYLLLNYDVKMNREGVRPPDVWLGPASIPSPSAKVDFRKCAKPY